VENKKVFKIKILIKCIAYIIPSEFVYILSSNFYNKIEYSYDVKSYGVSKEKPENIFQHILIQFFCSVGWFRGRGSEAKT